MILGYAGYNLTLRKKHVLINRTCRLATAREKGTGFLEQLFSKNLDDLKKILVWNVEHNIHFFRISSDIAPHITNPALLTNKKDWHRLAYSLDKFQPQLYELGLLAKQHQMRLTFHPNLFVVLNSPNPEVITRSIRDLYFHTRLLDLMELGPESVLVLHGGGVYQSKAASERRWIRTVKALPDFIRSRIVLENDETNYSIQDVLRISAKFQPPIPVVMDLFHYRCYQLKDQPPALKKKLIRKPHPHADPQILHYLALCRQTWPDPTFMKIHVSEQNPRLQFTAHSDYIPTLPPEVIKFHDRHPGPLWVMLESGKKELSLLKLRKRLSPP